MQRACTMSTSSSGSRVASAAGRPLALPGAPARRSVKASVASTLVRDVRMLDERAAFATTVESETLNKRLEAKAKALIALEDQEIPTWPLVRIRFQRESALGDAWKIVGRVPELGRFTPAVAPYLKWSQGHWWTYEGRVRPGTWLFKFMLRRNDGAYVWEDGTDRVLDVPETAGPEDVLEMTISDVKLAA